MCTADGIVTDSSYGWCNSTTSEGTVRRSKGTGNEYSCIGGDT